MYTCIRQAYATLTDVKESNSPSSIYTKYLQLQIRMLKPTASLQGPSINSDEFSASQSCSSNSNQLGYIQQLGDDTSSCCSTRPDFIQPAREPAGPNVV